MKTNERKFSFPVSIDPLMFDAMETARGTMSRSAFVREAIEAKLAGVSMEE